VGVEEIGEGAAALGTALGGCELSDEEGVGFVAVAEACPEVSFQARDQPGPTVPRMVRDLVAAARMRGSVSEVIWVEGKRP
jgi:hypothetical protein